MTLTFGEVAESHVGMQKIGSMAEKGFSYEELLQAQQYFESRGCDTLLVHLNQFLPQSGCDVIEQEQLQIAKTDPKSKPDILVARNGMKCLIDDDQGIYMLTEMLMFQWDKNLFNARRKVVQQKLARYNLNFDHVGQTANLKRGLGLRFLGTKYHY
jgi:hypothetical protein